MTKPSMIYTNKYLAYRQLFLCFIVITLILGNFKIYSQISYQNVTNRNVSLGSYGRVGVDWSFENGGSIGRRLNLNNMGSIGGRLEEQAYIEIVPAFHFKPKKGDSTSINAQVRIASYSQSITSIGNSSTTSLGGLAFAIPELFVEARNIRGKELSVWVGSRLYRGPDVHIADHFYFNDHSGQGFGVEYKDTRFATVFVASTDTTATVPPYFYLNIKTGTASASLRQRSVFLVEQDLKINNENSLTVLGEYHRMADADSNDETDPVEEVVNFPSDQGFVLGIRHKLLLKNLKKGSFNDFTLRYGSGIANGGDGGLSKTWLTYGAPDTISLNFKGAYSLAFVDHFVLNLSKKSTLNGYVILTKSKGAAPSNHKSKTYFGREVYNRKLDFTVGARNEYYITDYFHLLTELHYSQRKDGENPVASMFKFSAAPVFVPTGERDTWARPHLRFVASVSRYNDFAMESLYSPYLEFVGSKRWGYYFGVKAEWWIWH
ncbi:MAG: carbohydrate porin [Flavobacteriaceae bacterium]|nr:carbohydrate porin [Flavobacteriaceae bacterium]